MVFEIADLASALNMPALSILFSLLLGYTLVFVLFSKNKEWWRALGESDKIFFSAIIGIGAYWFSFIVMIILSVIWTLFFYDLVSIHTIDIWSRIFLVTFSAILWLQFFSAGEKIRDFILLLIQKTNFILMNFMVILIALSITIGLTQLSFLTKSLIFFSVMLIFPLLISYTLYLALTKTALKINFSIKNISRKIIFKEVTGGIVFIVLLLAFKLLFVPEVTYYDERVVTYNVDGKGVSLEALNENHLWQVYKQVTKSINITNGGFLGWIPVEYGAIITNDTNLEQSFNIVVETTDKYYPVNLFREYDKAYLKSLEKEVGITGIQLNKNNNKIIILFDRVMGIDKSKIKDIRIQGYEFAPESIISIKESAPTIVDSGGIFYMDVKNNENSKIDFRNFELNQFANYRRLWDKCEISFIEANGIEMTNRTIFQKYACNKNSCSLIDKSTGLADISPSMRGDELTIEWMVIEPKSSITFEFELNCIARNIQPNKYS
ncbi:MAG: hypothetical protein HYW23_04165 [Candidatus Aenigmarchaeota archaeon]|nr:hypothetical protein [Candidatus Aenigmarchaeota archaeon]